MILKLVQLWTSQPPVLELALATPAFTSGRPKHCYCFDDLTLNLKLIRFPSPSHSWLCCGVTVLLYCIVSTIDLWIVKSERNTDISKSGITMCCQHHVRRKKAQWTLVHQQQSWEVYFDPHKSTFSENHISALGVLPPEILKRTREWLIRITNDQP